MTAPLRVGFIGGGFMGGGIIQGLLERDVLTAADIAVCEPLPARRDELTQRYGVRTSDSPDDALAGDVLVVAVKPQDFATAAAALPHTGADGPLVVSIMAGVRLETIAAALPRARLVRLMPNLGASVGEGYSAWTAAPGVTEADRANVRQLFGGIGLERELPHERYIDMATAVTGSGPGYVMLLVESLIDGAVHIGLPRPAATEMVMQTVLGSTRWAQQEGGHPAELRSRVVSPGGTTAAGLLAMEHGGVRAALIDAVVAAYQKSGALGS